MQRRLEFARIRALLARSIYFRALSAGELDRLAELCRIRRLRSGQLLCSMAAPLDELCIVLSGGLRLAGVTASGQEFVYAVIGPGSFYGFGYLVDGSRAIAEARANGPTELALIEGSGLLALLNGDPRLWRHFCSLLTHRLTLAMSVIRDLQLAPLRQRIAQRLLGQAMSGGGEVEGAEPVELRLTQSDLGRMLGSSRSKINAELKRLEQGGLLKVAYRSVTLLDLPGLRALAGPDVFAF